MAENDCADSNGLFAVLIGQKAQGCWVGYGSVLFPEFGEPQPIKNPRLSSHHSGEWSLWCDRVLWRVEQGDRVLAGSEDERPEMEGAIEQINGRVLVSGQISQRQAIPCWSSPTISLLKTFVLTSEADARWQFNHGDAERVLLGPNLAATTDYAAGYFHGGQTLEKLGRVEEARALYERDIVVTTRPGDAHTRSELQAALDLLPI